MDIEKARWIKPEGYTDSMPVVLGPPPPAPDEKNPVGGLSMWYGGSVCV